MSAYVCVYVSMHALIQIHTHARTHARTHACTHTCIHIYKTVYVCVCIHRCIHTHTQGNLTTRPKTTCFPSSHDVIAVVRKNCQKKITTNQKKSLYLHVLVCMDITRHRLPRVGPALRRKRPIKEQKRPMKKQKRPIIYNEASPAKSRARVGHRKKYPKKEQPHIRT